MLETGQPRPWVSAAAPCRFADPRDHLFHPARTWRVTEVDSLDELVAAVGRAGVDQAWLFDDLWLVSDGRASASPVVAALRALEVAPPRGRLRSLAWLDAVELCPGSFTSLRLSLKELLATRVCPAAPVLSALVESDALLFLLPPGARR